MAEMELTLKQASEILGLTADTIAKWIRTPRDPDKPPFPRAHLLHGAKKKGYRIPIGDIASYAASQGGAYCEQVEQRVAQLSACA